MPRRVVPWAVWGTIIVVLALAYLNQRLELEILRLQRPHIYDNQYLLPPASTIRAAALNHATAASDLVWIGGILYVGDSMVASRKATDSTYYARTIVELDPLFYKVYEWHAAARMMASGYPSTDDIDAANDLLKVGMRYFPLDWRLPFGVVSNYIGFTHNLSPEVRLAQAEDGAIHAEIAASLPGSPDYLPMLAMSFHRRVAALRAGQTAGNDAEHELTPEQREFLARLYVESDSAETREYIVQRLRAAGEEDYVLRRGEQARRALEQAYDAGLNYLTVDLFTIVDRRAQSSLTTAPSLDIE